RRLQAQRAGAQAGHAQARRGQRRPAHGRHDGGTDPGRGRPRRSEERRVGKEGRAPGAACDGQEQRAGGRHAGSRRGSDAPRGRPRLPPRARPPSILLFFSSRRRHTRSKRDWSSDVCSSDLDGYKRNAQAHKRVMRKHAAANDDLRTVGTMEGPIRAAAGREWADCLKIGERNGWRNAQASLLAPTGCLTGDTMVTTDRGLVRLSELGDVHGPKWQELSARVSTDDGPRQATKFFVNGEEPTRSIVTEGGHRLQGTYTHRIKIVDQETGAWEWKRFADITEGDVVPMQLGTMVGEPRRVVLPVLDRAHDAEDHDLFVPETLDEELAELVGHFVGEGDLHT